MDQLYQNLINTFLGIACAAGGWLMNNMWKLHQKHQFDNAKLAADLAEVKLLVAGKYVLRTDLEAFVNRVFNKLDAIEDKVTEAASKADRVATILDTGGRK